MQEGLRLVSMSSDTIWKGGSHGGVLVSVSTGKNIAEWICFEFTNKA